MDRIERVLERVLDKGVPIAVIGCCILFAVHVLRGYFGG